MKSELVIYKASAGSGKTFRLATEYIKLLIENPKSYKNILAVTFTNKATAEMKVRIMSELYGLSRRLNESKPYLEIIREETQKSDDEICRQATTALTLILHDYNKFRIETIDSFFQSILRNMAKELGLSANFNINLNDDEIRQNAIAQMIENASENNGLLRWLKEYIAEKIAENKSWKINDDIENFYRNIISEKFKSRQDEVYERFAEKDFLRLSRAKLKKTIDEENAKMQNFATQFFEIILKNNLCVDDFYQANRGVCGYFKKLNEKQYLDDKTFNKYVETCSEDSEKWCKNKSKESEITALAANILMPLLNDAETQREKSTTIVNTCNLIINNLNNLGLLSDILKCIREYSNSNNIFLLSDTSVLLSKMINNNDTSFIFEKIGATIQHLMIDEFQDTSQLQWANFEPLLIECLSQGYSNLIVGDVKQAIYRWRNGNWQILNNIEKNQDLKYFNPVVQTLNNSWRSAKSIVEFNNNLFGKIIDILENECQLEYGESCDDLKSAYSDINQICKKDVLGFVSVEFLEKTEYENETLKRLVENIETLQDNGVKTSDIAILVRKNEQTKKIAQYFQKYRNENPDKNYSYNLVSSKTFTLNSSVAINIIINALQFLIKPENTVAQAELAFYYQKNILKNDIKNNEIFESKIQNLFPKEFTENAESLKLTPLYELVEKIYLIFELKKLDENAEYMFSFLDKISEYLKTESSDISKFLEFWHTNLFKNTIEISGEMDGIKILTIHESKGLEFHSVIIPFCDWTLGAEGENYIWCETNQDPFTDIGLLPIKYVSKAKKSIFAADHKNETMQLWVDNVNILYVATTRAKNNLIILSKQEEKNNIAAVMYSALNNENFTAGEIIATKNTIDKKSENKINITATAMSVPFVSSNYKTTFIQSSNAQRFAESSDTETVSSILPVERGKLLHRIFAEIKSKNDINDVVNKFQFEGIIKENEKEELKNFVVNAIAQSQVEHWYCGTYKLFNECSIITKNDENEIVKKRPDRVMIDDENTIIVDFKFGKINKKYNKQVTKYMELMCEMNYKNVRGFLWYVDDNLVEEIK